MHKGHSLEMTSMLSLHPNVVKVGKNVKMEMLIRNRAILYGMYLELDCAMCNNKTKTKNDRHEGFARGHPPYYWPRLSTLNFLDLTG